jgi:KEOPS complex subunit Cgi121
MSMHSERWKETDIEIRQVRFLVTNTSHFLRFLRSVADENACHLILFDAAKMAGKKHVIASMSHAIRSFADGTCISNSLEMEALLYAAGTRQTNIAMQFGVHGGINRSYLCSVPHTARVWTALRPQMTEEDEDWEVFSPEKEARLVKLFGITSEEREAAGHVSLQDLVIERVALLEVLK